MRSTSYNNDQVNEVEHGLVIIQIVGFKNLYLCASVRGLLPGYALQSTPDRDKTWKDNTK
ncbi:hypothetical protein [Proteiniphilum sp. X52]|uniref:hypothetical protein n=1 Tax=Proteiniphilum sp. X52 TaxID=2382159 RepID=UPI001314AD38|nr:hypothetical protein [Proteiniphilum sp. X52]